MAFSIQFSRSISFYFLLFLFTSSFLVSVLSQSIQPQTKGFLATKRRMLEEEEQPKQKAKLISSSKNQTKLTKSTPTTTNSSKSTNSTKSSKPSNTTTTTLSKSLFKKLNSTSKPSNSSKLTTLQTKKSSDLPKNKTQPITTKQSSPPNNKKIQSTPKPQITSKPKPNRIYMEDNEDEDFISEFRDLPSKFHQTLLPDLESISITSKGYMIKANKEISEGFRPLVGKQYAPTIASLISCVLILLPLLIISLVFNRIKAYFPLQTILIFIQLYLSIYFFILSLASLLTGLEPLKLFYVTSQSSYVCLQVFQTLGYVLYLLLLLMNLVVVFSTETGLGTKILSLGQTIVGCAVGLHYYVAVFHRAVLHQPPKTNWKVHWIYATCFLTLCLFARAERRKKAYLELDGQEGKKS